jgi:putative ABC transport system substrate-binding protein
VRRREFILAVGGAAAAYPLAARAQQAAMPVIGFLDTRSPGEAASVIVAFGDGLNEAGYTEGRNVAIEYRWAEGRYDRMAGQAADLASRRVAVIFAGGPGAVTAAKTAAPAIPIVFITGQDPVRLGLVASLARPGGNATGVNFLTAEVGAKRLNLLRELMPATARVAVLVNPANATSTDSTLKDVTAAASASGLRLSVLNAATGSEIDAAFATFALEKPDALLVAGDAFFSSRRIQLVHQATRLAIPATYSQREFADVGGLMSYGPNLDDVFRQIGAYVGRMLKGATPPDLPVVQSSRFELVLNAETARLLGLAIPSTLLALADEVIE